MSRFLLLLLIACCSFRSLAQNEVRVLLRLEPDTKRFWCHYTLVLPADSAHTEVLLNLNKQFKVLSVHGSHVKQQCTERLYPVFQDTMEGISLSYTAQDRSAHRADYRRVRGQLVGSLRHRPGYETA